MQVNCDELAVIEHFEIEHAIRGLIRRSGGIENFLERLGVVCWDENNEAGGGLCPSEECATLIEAALRISKGSAKDIEGALQEVKTG
jgi:hypothetical protein